MVYLDTPALARPVTLEPETDRLRAYLAARPDAIRFATAVAHAELLRAAHFVGDEAVATASVAGDRLEAMVTYDARLVQAAAAMGLPVARP